MTRLAGKTCFVTGAASGIGRAVAEAAAREGARLVLSDINEAPLQEVAEGIRAGSGTVLAVGALDVSDYEAVQVFTRQVLDAHGSMDVVMNIAGIAIWGDITQLEHRHWRSVIDVNLMGPIHVMECLVPAMVAAGRGGHIVNVSSAAGLFPLPLHAAYSASKFGLRGASEVLRFDLRQRGVRVSVVCPGAVDTGLVKTVKIVGFDEADPLIGKLRGRFQRHAATPEQAAARILRGVRKNRFIIYTSLDIRLVYLSKRWFPMPFGWVMAEISRQVQKLAARHAARLGEQHAKEPPA